MTTNWMNKKKKAWYKWETMDQGTKMKNYLLGHACLKPKRAKWSKAWKSGIPLHYPEPKKKTLRRLTDHHHRLRSRAATAMAAAAPHAYSSLVPVSAARPLSGSTGESVRPTLVARVRDLLLYQSVVKQINLTPTSRSLLVSFGASCHKWRKVPAWRLHCVAEDEGQCSGIRSGIIRNGYLISWFL